jgi:hypothetical protein
LQTLNTAVANDILALSKSARRALTSKSFAYVEIGSAWINVFRCKEESNHAAPATWAHQLVVLSPVVRPVGLPTQGQRLSGTPFVWLLTLYRATAVRLARFPNQLRYS